MNLRARGVGGVDTELEETLAEAVLHSQSNFAADAGAAREGHEVHVLVFSHELTIE